MNKITTKAQHGVSAIFYLAQGGRDKMRQLSEIAGAIGVSRPYLEQIMVILRRQGLVQVKRGPHGGYQLACSTEEITILRILDALEGEIKLVNKPGKNDTLCRYWNETETGIKAIYGVTIRELHDRDIKAKKSLSFQI